MNIISFEGVELTRNIVLPSTSYSSVLRSNKTVRQKVRGSIVRHLFY